MKKKIAIWGTGNTGRNLFYKLRASAEIVCWYDDEDNSGNLYNLEIRKFDKKRDDETIIVTGSNWINICKRLQKSGLEIINDYIPYWVYNKKMIPWKNLLWMDHESIRKIFLYLKKSREIAVVYGNCQTELIQHFLSESEEFISRYLIINIPRVCQEDEKVWATIIESNIFLFCDLFIYQVVLESNKYGIQRSTLNIEKMLNANCIKVSIPNIYFDGYFPQLEKNAYNVLEDVQEDGLFKWGDKFVNNLLLEGSGVNEIIKTIFDENYLSKEEIYKCINQSFENLQRREEHTNITISDYIRKHFEKRQLFFSPNHPNNELLLECTVRILDFLGMDTVVKTEVVNSHMSLMGEDVVVYPSVVKKIGLQEFYKSFFPNRYIENLAYSAVEYYKLYCEIISIELGNGKD